jgi:hypothetical protein
VTIFVKGTIICGKEFNERCKGHKFYVTVGNDSIFQEGWNEYYDTVGRHCFLDFYCHIEAIIF